MYIYIYKWKFYKLIISRSQSLRQLGSHWRHRQSRGFCLIFRVQLKPGRQRAWSPTYTFCTNIMSNTVFRIPVILKIIRNLKTNSSASPDDIPAILTKKCASELPCAPAPILSNIILYKFSYNSGIFPESWKLGRIQPIKKRDDSSKVKNYRPIATSPVLSKIT